MHSMSACNRFSESIVHLACRRSSLEVVRFILSHGGDPGQVDDYGRNSMHDACWRPDPDFEVVALLLDLSPELVRCCDSRGATPLQYVHKDHWAFWCDFLHQHRDRFWPCKN